MLLRRPSAQFILEIWVGNINRCALAPVSAEPTGANALRLIQKSNLDRALVSYTKSPTIGAASACPRPRCLNIQHLSGVAQQ